MVLLNKIKTLVVASILPCRLSKKRLSDENALTVTCPQSSKAHNRGSEKGGLTIPINSSEKFEKIGDRELDSIRRRSRPVFLKKSTISGKQRVSKETFIQVSNAKFIISKPDNDGREYKRRREENDCQY